MLIKEKDSLENAIRQLDEIKQLPNLSGGQVAKIDRELKWMKSGNRGEQDSAYFINFYFKDNKKWVVIHDLRLEYDGFVAQIDHLLINRFMEFYVLETKNYANGIKITERGEFLVWTRNRYISIESPIEQNQRHIAVLEKLLKSEDLLPKRLGFTLTPKFIPYVLVSPKSKVIRPDKKLFNTDMIIKADAFYQQTRDNIDNESTISLFGAATKFIPLENVQELAERLISYHQPFEIDYYAKFGISREQQQATPGKKRAEEKKESARQQSRYYCYACKKPISQKVAKFCFDNRKRFNGKAYCYNCQKKFR